MPDVSAKKIDPRWAWQPYRPSDEAPWNLQRVGHLYRRAAFGATLAELNDAVAAGPDRAVDLLLRGRPTRPEATPSTLLGRRASAQASGAADSGATSTDVVTSAGVDAGAGGSAVGCSGVGGAAASGGVSIATGDSGGSGGSVAAGTWTSGASAGLRPFLCLAALPCGLGDCLLAMVGSPRCG